MPDSEDDFANSQAMNRQSAHVHDKNTYNDYAPRPSSVSTPFSAFKRFIDDNLSTFTNNFKNLPSNFAQLRSDMETAHRLQAETERDISTRWSGSSDPPEDIQRHINRLSPQESEAYAHAARWFLETAADHNAHIPLEKIVTLYRDHESNMGLLDQLASPLLTLGGTWMYMPEVGDTLPTASNWSLMGLATNPRWLSVDWFRRSPYSPVRLEAHPDQRQDGEKWRAAFEDLMLSALGKPMLCGSERDIEQRLPGLPGLDWMLSLQHRGILPPLLPRFYTDVQARQQLSHKSILDIIRGCNAPWGGIERPWQDSITKDFTELREALAFGGTVLDLEGLAFPKTELDMYDRQEAHAALKDSLRQLVLFEEQNKERKASLQEVRHLGGLVAPSGQEPGIGNNDDDDDDDSCPIANEHRRRALQAHEWSLLREAAESGEINDPDVARYAFEVLRKANLSSAADLLQAWGSGYDAADEDDRSVVARDASDTGEFEKPKDGRWHTESVHVQETGASVGKDNGKRRELYRRLTNVLGEDEEWARYASMSTSVLEDAVERLEEEEENLRRMVNGGRAVTNFEELKRPDVLSALTTTQTTRLPDGTVTTKVVLKKRFGDGSEEIRESVHTYNEVTEAETEDQEARKKDEKRSGWFWR